MLERLPRPLALLVLGLLLLAGAWCFVSPAQAPDVAEAGGYTDFQLYADITAKVAAGTPYHQAAAEVQRAHGYPLRPFVTMRPPALFVLAARLGLLTDYDPVVRELRALTAELVAARIITVLTASRRAPARDAPAVGAWAASPRRLLVTYRVARQAGARPAGSRGRARRVSCLPTRERRFTKPALTRLGSFDPAHVYLP